ncbi:MAG: hypothetical protein Q9220_001597 [cf. Caloplaca sp. 1 TL-2023]
MNTDLHYFSWLSTQPRLQHAFNVVMGIPRKTHTEEWFEYYPVHERLLSGLQQPDTPSNPQSPPPPTKSPVILVDVGGGLGHDLLAFHTAHSHLLPNGSLILQDTPAVVSAISPSSLPATIIAQPHDFFTQQPIRGARAYYLHTVLHDWPDTQALAILSYIRDAMAADSVLLVLENALPEQGVPLYNAMLDFSMMALFAGLERTDRQFEDLLQRAGFVLRGVWRPRERVLGSATLYEAVVEVDKDE